MNYEISPNIHSELSLGKYINRRILNEKTDIREDNILYSEIVDNISEYIHQYKGLGYELNIREDSIFISKNVYTQIEDPKNIDKSSLKLYTLAICLFRFLDDNKVDVYRTLLTDENGLSLDEMNKVFDDPKFSPLLDSVGFKSASNPIQDTLVKRNILEKNKNGNFVLSDVGKFFLEDFVEREGSMVLENLS